MRRKYFGLAMAAVATLGPVQAFGGDREIAQSIYGRLQVSRDAGQLKNFNLDMKVDEGVVLFRGKVVGDEQRAVVLASSEGIDGVLKVVDELKVEKAAQVVQSKPAKLYRPGAKQAVETATASSETTPMPSQVAQAAKGADSFDFAQALTSPEIAAPENKSVEPSSTAQLMTVPESVVIPPPFDADKIARTARPKTDAVAASPVAPQPAMKPHVQEVVPGIVQPAAAFEGSDNAARQAIPVSSVEPVVDDNALTNAVVRAIGRAKAEGHVKNFGIDVNSFDGMIQLEGTASSVQQREFLGNIARHAPGARGVRNLIEVEKRTPTPTKTVSHRSPAPTPAPALQSLPQGSQPQMAAMPTPAPQRSTQPRQTMQAVQRQAGRPLAARPASYGQSYGGNQVINGEQVVPGSMVTHGGDGGSYQGGGYGMGSPVGGQISGAPIMGSPVPMAPAAPAGAPRYDSPNLPNYAWPGYAAYPNYAALSYPQQYSPSAFPYIGPFYPYPQVPLGWRKVSLEWDDGWWFLDFTDK